LISNGTSVVSDLVELSIDWDGGNNCDGGKGVLEGSSIEGEVSAGGLFDVSLVLSGGSWSLGDNVLDDSLSEGWCLDGGGLDGSVGVQHLNQESGSEFLVETIDVGRFSVEVGHINVSLFVGGKEHHGDLSDRDSDSLGQNGVDVGGIITER